MRFDILVRCDALFMWQRSRGREQLLTKLFLFSFVFQQVVNRTTDKSNCIFIDFGSRFFIVEKASVIYQRLETNGLGDKLAGLFQPLNIVSSFFSSGADNNICDVLLKFMIKMKIPTCTAKLLLNSRGISKFISFANVLIARSR